MKARKWVGLVGLLMVGGATTAVSVGCAGDAQSNDGDPPGEVIAHVDSRLTAGTVVSIDGTYTGCTAKSGAWSVRVSGSGALTNPSLSVVMNDTSCQLAITAINADQVYTAATPLALGATYAASPSTFSNTAGTATFQANAMLSSALFSSDFSITLVHTDNPGLTDAGSFVGSYATVQTTTVTTLVPAPNYTISLSANTPLSVLMDVNKTIVSTAGVASLFDGTNTGSSYIVDRGTLPATGIALADVTAAWLTESVAGRVYSISGSNPTIPASQFALSGSLSSNITRNVIVLRTVGGVPAYQVFRVTFKGS